MPNTKSKSMSNDAIIEAFRKKVVTFNYSTSLPTKPTKFDKEKFLKLAKEVGKIPAADDALQSRPLQTTP